VRKDQDLAAEAERFDRAIVEAVAAGSTFEQRSLKLSEESGVVMAITGVLLEVVLCAYQLFGASAKGS
jgi:hypothetical protein